MKRFLFILAIFLLIPAKTFATNYHVDQDGGAANLAACSGADPGNGNRCTITQANGVATPTTEAHYIYLYDDGGNMNTMIDPANDGTASYRIIWKAADDEEPTIANIDTPLDLSNRSYITIYGLNTSNTDKFLTMTNGTHNTIEQSTFDTMRNYDRFRGFLVGQNSQYNWIHHNTISRYGYMTATQDYGDMAYVGDGNPGTCAYNLVEYNHMYYGGHNVFSLNGMWNVVRHNYFHNEAAEGFGNRLSAVRDDSGGTKGWNLFEDNRYGFAVIGSDASYTWGIQLTSHDNIIRRNYFYSNGGPGIGLVTNANHGNPWCDDNYIYHNVFFYNGYNASAGYRYGIRWSSRDYGDPGGIQGTVLKNNIFYLNPNGAYYFTGAAGSINNQIIENNWETGNPNFIDADAGLLDPGNSTYPDFGLRSNSGCINNGGFLTTITSATGNGTSFVVADAHYFMDGWGIPNVSGDEIQLEGQTSTRTVTDVNYGTNTITVSSSVSWTQGDGVALAYNGSAPDQGAIEYGEVTDTIPPNAYGYNPAKNAANVAPDADIIAHIVDGSSGVDISTITLTEEGNVHCCSGQSCVGGTADLTCTGTSSDYTITLSGRNYDYLQVVNVTLNADDGATNSMLADSYQYTIEDQPGQVQAHFGAEVGQGPLDLESGSGQYRMSQNGF